MCPNLRKTASLFISQLVISVPHYDAISEHYFRKQRRFETPFERVQIKFSIKPTRRTDEIPIVPRSKREASFSVVFIDPLSAVSI